MLFLHDIRNFDPPPPVNTLAVTRGDISTNFFHWSTILTQLQISRSEPILCRITSDLFPHAQN